MSDSSIPPLPTNDGAAGASDFATTSPALTAADLDILSRPPRPPINIEPTDFKKWLDKTRIMTDPFALFADIIADIIIGLLKIDEKFALAWEGLELEILDRMFPKVMSIDVHQHEILLQLLGKAFGTEAGSQVRFGSGELASTIQALFNQMVQPFTLLNSGINPATRGSGIRAQQYLLSTGLNLLLQQKVIDDLSNHMGLGLLKTLTPYLGIIDRSVNPANVVRQAMDASYTMLLKAPLTRDLNRAYPIKDLGVTTLCRMFLADIIDEATYLDQCLDSGLDATKAQALVLITKNHHSPAALAKLLKHKQITAADAKKLLKQAGYQSADADVQMYIESHARYFAIEERVGTAAVTAWRHGYITQTRLEEILQLTGFTEDEINLLEIEGEFVKQAAAKGVDVTNPPGSKDLTYTQVKQLFEANIIGIDDVIAFLERQGYSDAAVIDLTLLDFTVAAERAARRNTLQARLRVTAQQDLVAADAAAAKNETALADARRQLSAELQAEADALGTPLERAGILTLLGL